MTIAASRSAGAGRRRDRRVDDQAMAILGQQMAEIRQLGFAPRAFLIEARIGIGRRLMGVVAPRLPMEIHGRILRVVGRRPRRVLRFETLVARPRLEQRAIDGEVLVRQQPVRLDGGQHFRKERVGDVAIEQPIAVFRKSGGGRAPGTTSSASPSCASPLPASDTAHLGFASPWTAKPMEFEGG